MISRGLRAAKAIALALVAAAGIATAAPTTAEASCLPASLKRTLNQIEKKFGSVSIVSTSRPGARISGSGRPSLHASCRAVDFNPPRGKYTQVANWLKANHDGGVGTYSCGMHHIHIDNGPSVRFHRCQSASGPSKSSTKVASASKSRKSAKIAAAGKPRKLVGLAEYAMAQ